MLLVPTIIRCCAHIVRLVCGQTDRQMDGRSGYYYYNSHAIVNHTYHYSILKTCRTVRGRSDKPSTVTLRRMRRGSITNMKQLPVLNGAARHVLRAGAGLEAGRNNNLISKAVVHFVCNYTHRELRLPQEINGQPKVSSLVQQYL